MVRPNRCSEPQSSGIAQLLKRPGEQIDSADLPDFRHSDSGLGVAVAHKPGEVNGATVSRLMPSASIMAPEALPPAMTRRPTPRLENRPGKSARLTLVARVKEDTILDQIGLLPHLRCTAHHIGFGSMGPDAAAHDATARGGALAHVAA